MKLVTIEQAREHVHSDGDDDVLLTTYVNAAEAMCAQLANRSLFPTQEDRDAAIIAIPDAMTAAYAAYDAAVVDAGGQDDSRIAGMLIGNAQVALNRATYKADADIHGVAVDDPEYADLIAAVLLTAAHWYRNRENVTTGQGASAADVPMTAQAICSNHRWIGPL